jgi:cell division protein FtsW (lipid II flippase)
MRFGSISFQPSEVARLALVVFFAQHLSRWRLYLRATPTSQSPFRPPAVGLLFPVMLAGATALALQVFHDDLGPGAILFTSAVMTASIVTRDLWYVLAGALAFPVGVVSAAVLSGRALARIEDWVGRGSGDRFQVDTAGAAARRGDLLGVQPGDLLSAPDVPLARNDMVIAAVAEIGGLLLVSVVMATFVVLVGVALRISNSPTSDQFGAAAVGASVALVASAFVNLGGTLRLLPLTGVPLPFLSSGGTAMLMSWMALGLMAATGRSAREAFNEDQEVKR